MLNCMHFTLIQLFCEDPIPCPATESPGVCCSLTRFIDIVGLTDGLTLIHILSIVEVRGKVAFHFGKPLLYGRSTEPDKLFMLGSFHVKIFLILVGDVL